MSLPKYHTPPPPPKLEILMDWYMETYAVHRRVTVSFQQLWTGNDGDI